MDRRNTLYYMAAVGTVLVFIVALIGLSTCGEGASTQSAAQEQAILDAYRQGYLDGYSKGYSDGFSSGRGSDVAQRSDVSHAAALEATEGDEAEAADEEAT